MWAISIFTLSSHVFNHNFCLSSIYLYLCSRASLSRHIITFNFNFAYAIIHFYHSLRTHYVFFLVSDITGGNYRKSIICLFETFWGIGVVLLPLVAHLFPSWTSIYMAISLPTTVYMLIWPLIPDSPRWHIRHKHTENVKKILLIAAKVNDRQYLVPHNLDHQINVQAAASHAVIDTPNWWSLWCDRKSIITIVVLHTAWAIYVTNYNGMLLNIRAFGRNFLTANTIVAGLSEISGVLMAWFLVMRLPNHKWYWSGVFNIATGILTCLGFFIPETCKYM